MQRCTTPSWWMRFVTCLRTTVERPELTQPDVAQVDWLLEYYKDYGYANPVRRRAAAACTRLL
eukprot:1230449-Rhodomonas_salina.4